MKTALRRSTGFGTQRGRRYGMRAAALAAAGALALASCSGDASSDEPTADNPTNSGDTSNEDDGNGEGNGNGAEEELEVMDASVLTFLPMDTLDWTPEMVAYSGGFFEEHGLNVEMQMIPGGAAAVQAIIGDAVDMTRVSTLDILPPLESGQPIMAVGMMAYQTNLRMASAATNPLEEAADLEGEIIGMGSVGGTSENMLNMALDANGVDRDLVERQAVPVSGSTFELVRRGDLSGYIVSHAVGLELEAQHDDAIISGVGLTDVPDRMAWVVHEDSLEDPEGQERTRRLLAALHDATEFIINDEENDFANVLQILRDSGDYNFPSLMDDELAASIISAEIDQTWTSPDESLPILGNDMDGWVAAYELYAEKGFVEGDQDPLEWITSDYLPSN